MSKMGDMAATIEELRNAAAAINDAANWLAEAFSSADDAIAESAGEVPDAEPALTLEDVRAILAEKSRAGHTAESIEMAVFPPCPAGDLSRPGSPSIPVDGATAAQLHGFALCGQQGADGAPVRIQPRLP